MSSRKRKRWYLLWAALSFLFAFYGFAGRIDGKEGGQIDPLYAGFMFSVIGVFFIYCHVANKRARKASQLEFRPLGKR
jgi:drug/metabolite transporter (DMT)-like permease